MCVLKASKNLMALVRWKKSLNSFSCNLTVLWAGSVVLLFSDGIVFLARIMFWNHVLNHILKSYFGIKNMIFFVKTAQISMLLALFHLFLMIWAYKYAENGHKCWFFGQNHVFKLWFQNMISNCKTWFFEKIRFCLNHGASYNLFIYSNYFILALLY